MKLNYTLTLTDGRRETFIRDLNLVASWQKSYLNYIPEPGVSDTFSWNLDDYVMGVDEQQLVTRDNTIYDYKDGKLQSISLPDGTSLRYTDAGVYSPTTDTAVTYQRDPVGRITKVIAPDETFYSYQYNSRGDLVKVTDPMGALALAASDRYAPNGTIIKIGQSEEPEFLGIERHGFPLEKAREYGYDPGNLEDLPVFWEMGAYTNPEVVDLLIRAADKYNLWKHPFIDAIGPLHIFIPRTGRVGKYTRSIEIESNRSLLGEANKVTYKTPDYMLSSAVDYRPGERGNQHHIWQATLSPDAIVFTTNPGSLGTWGEELSPDKIDFAEKGAHVKTKWNRTPTYWTGQNRLPRVAQYKNVSIIIYNINPFPALGERMVFPFTHAFFPRWAFDEVVEDAGWVFGRVGNGYIALYSSLPVEWRNPKSASAHDVIA